MKVTPVPRSGAPNLRRRASQQSAGESLSTLPSAIAARAVVCADFSSSPQTRILVIDDDKRICDLLSRVLVRSNYDVQTVLGAEQALGVLSGRNFDLVVCDMQMGGMSGLEFTTLVVKLYPELPVILMTAHHDTDLMRASLREGAVDFIPKPFNSETITIIIERNLERWAINQKRAEAHRTNQIFSNVQVLAAAIDAKEPFTAQHSRRVARLSRSIAEALNFSKDDQQCVDWAAQVHDVGKIATPDHILLKSGRLTEDEWRVIREHPAKGAEIVSQVKDLCDVAGIVRSHHERIDGNGYPDGLCGEQIPMPARIIAVADAYEVMTSNRVYRSRISESEAMRRLKAGQNSQFDSAVVRAFEQLPPESRL